MKKPLKKSKDKRMKVDVWVTDGLRKAVRALNDGTGMASDPEVRRWCQGVMDNETALLVDEYERSPHSK